MGSRQRLSLLPAPGAGFGPGAILETAARTARYSADEVGQLEFAGETPDAADLGRKWHQILEAARETIANLPPDEAGQCVLDLGGGLARLAPKDLTTRLATRSVYFHRGSIRGAWPRLVG